MSLGAAEGTANTRAQQVAKEANQVESLFRRPSLKKISTSPSSKRDIRLPSDEEKLYDKDHWNVPNEPYDDDLSSKM